MYFAFPNLKPGYGPAHNQWSASRVERARRYIYTISNLQCWKCARMRFHCVNAVTHISGNIDNCD